MKSIIKLTLSILISINLLLLTMISTIRAEDVNDVNYVYLPFITNGVNSTIPEEMILIPAGEFQMGCDPEHNAGYPCNEYGDNIPLHTIYLDAYFIDKLEITNSQYSKCVEANSCTLPSPTFSVTRSSYYDNPTYANFPVINVSWYDAAKYCAWAEKRLPTEAEWEKAARGINPRSFPWGDQTPTCSLVNYSENLAIGDVCIGDTSEVGSYPLGASPYGVMDMAGNVWEWVNDWYDNDYYNYSPYSNPFGPEEGTEKILRGGSFSNYSYGLLTGIRHESIPEERLGDGGFRCAASP